MHIKRLRAENVGYTLREIGERLKATYPNWHTGIRFEVESHTSGEIEACLIPYCAKMVGRRYLPECSTIDECFEHISHALAAVNAGDVSIEEESENDDDGT